MDPGRVSIRLHEFEGFWRNCGILNIENAQNNLSRHACESQSLKWKKYLLKVINQNHTNQPLEGGGVQTGHWRFFVSASATREVDIEVPHVTISKGNPPREYWC